MGKEGEDEASKGLLHVGEGRKRGWARGEERGKGRARRDLAPTS